MENEKKGTIVCLTNSYPYGTRETYFETELQYLAAKFEKVIILPKYNPYNLNVKRNIPSNVVVWNPIVPRNKVIRFLVGLLNLSPFSFYITEFFERKLYKNFRYITVWLKSMLMYRRMYSKTRGLFEELDPKQTVVYSYWAGAPIFITKKLSFFKKAVRMHRGDFYEDEAGGYLPLRRKIYYTADLLVPISRQISNILIKDYSVDEQKISVNYLGVSNNSIDRPTEIETSHLTVVSCSRVDPIKRVDLIAEAVLGIEESQEITWHHFGDGMEFDALKEYVNNASNNIKIVLHGWAEQEELLSFYSEQEITWFINVSQHEGVPVSIMEAMSFAIPCIASDVGATNELVNDENGILVSKNVTAEEIRRHILSFENADYHKKRENAYNFWRENFNADKNYKKLCEDLYCLTVI